MTDVRVVLVTAPDEDTAARIATSLLDERLVACVNVVGGVRSLYRWKSGVCDEAEALMIMKTSASRADALSERIIELHPYEVAEVLLLPVTGGAEAYLSWVLDETRPEETS